ncbi:MAG: hypothetical protein ABI232_08610 [Jatrophihabitantaceae bacterium]
MLHPVGSHSPAVYWRRRLVLLAALVLLVLLSALTVRAVMSSDDGAAVGAQSPAPTSGGASQTGTSSSGSSSPPTSQSPSQRSTSPGKHASSGTTKSSAAPVACTPAQLKVAAVVGKTQYAVGDEPVLALKVTNSGPAACIQNVADSEIVLSVFNGASRVWGSHDCIVAPGTDDRTLAVGQPAEFSIRWTGLTSQPNCAGTRQRVGAGTYTLYAMLAGHQGAAAQFGIS